MEKFSAVSNLTYFYKFNQETQEESLILITHNYCRLLGIKGGIASIINQQTSKIELWRCGTDPKKLKYGTEIRSGEYFLTYPEDNSKLLYVHPKGDGYLLQPLEVNDITSLKVKMSSEQSRRNADSLYGPNYGEIHSLEISFSIGNPREKVDDKIKCLEDLDDMKVLRVFFYKNELVVFSQGYLHFYDSTDFKLLRKNKVIDTVPYNNKIINCFLITKNLLIVQFETEFNLYTKKDQEFQLNQKFLNCKFSHLITVIPKRTALISSTEILKLNLPLELQIEVMEFCVDLD